MVEHLIATERLKPRKVQWNGQYSLKVVEHLIATERLKLASASGGISRDAVVVEHLIATERLKLSSPCARLHAEEPSGRTPYRD